MLHDALQTEGIVNFRVELVWKEGDENAASSIFLTSDGRVILQGRAISDEERRALFSDWFDDQLRRAEVRVDRHFGQWDAGRGVVQ